MKKNNKFSYEWDWQFGQNPVMPDIPWPFYNRPLEVCALDWEDTASEELQMNSSTQAAKHLILWDCTYAAGAQIASSIALAPSFVKDLAGRVVNIGYGPLKKDEQEWRGRSKALFPRFCALEDDGGDFDSFSTLFRPLDFSSDISGLISDANDDDVPLAPLLYQAPNLYPYKLRLDTFYIDGWRLPQTEYLFVKADDINLKDSENLAADFYTCWNSRATGMDYEAFVEAQGGEAWFIELFEKGVTVIPTFEAHNGFNKVDANFNLQDYWPGRAVQGLHKVVEKRPHDAPAGTILAVLRPGIALARRIEPAEVVVSDGSGYRSPHQSDPLALLPDLRLPHTRTAPVWGACWLPTHPSHFEAPSLWGWDSRGFFLQKSGPLWDPLHYYYQSVDEVVRAFKDVQEDNYVPVPEHMKTRFYPATTMAGFDAMDVRIKEMRLENGIPIKSSIKRIPQEQASSTLGYHPLPLELEFELDNWLLPMLAPQHMLANTNRPAPDILNRLAKVIRSHISPSDYIMQVEEQPEWFKDPQIMRVSTGRPQEDYPALNRYLSQNVAIDDFMQWFNLHLEHINQDILQATPYQIWSEDNATSMDKVVVGFYSAVMQMREKGFSLMRMRHELYRKYPDIYYQAYWQLVSPAEIYNEIDAQDDVRVNRAQEMSDYLSQEESGENKTRVLSGAMGNSSEEFH